VQKTIYQFLSSFIANAYNDLYAFYTEKREPIGRGAVACTALSFESAADPEHHTEQYEPR